MPKPLIARIIEALDRERLGYLNKEDYVDGLTALTTTGIISNIRIMFNL
jgi:hypothetical protein